MDNSPTSTPPSKPTKKPAPTDQEIPEVAADIDANRFDREFVYVPLSAMNPAPYNPRQITKEAREALRHSLDTYGLVQPLVWNKTTGNLVGGHQRFDLLKEQGAAGAKAYVVEISEEEEQVLNITLNNPAVQGEFNAKALKSIIAALKGKRSKEEFAKSGLEAMEKQLPLYDGLETVKAAPPAPDPTIIDGDAPDLSYITPTLRGLAVPINSLKPDKGNVRQHDQRNRLAVRTSLQRFGQLRPIVIHKKTVMAGNCTWEESKALDRKFIAVVDVSHMSVAEMVAFGIVDNKSAELASTNFEALATVFRKMDQDWLPFTGYEAHEVEPLLAAEWQPPAPTDDATLEANAHEERMNRGITITGVAGEMLERILTAMDPEPKDVQEGVRRISEHLAGCEGFALKVPTDNEDAPEVQAEAGQPAVDLDATIATAATTDPKAEA